MRRLLLTAVACASFAAAAPTALAATNPTPAGTPPEVIAKLNAEAVRALKQPDAAARITADGAEIHLETPHYGISPGQAAAFYLDERVIGGGWIAKAA